MIANLMRYMLVLEFLLNPFAPGTFTKKGLFSEVYSNRFLDTIWQNERKLHKQCSWSSVPEAKYQLPTRFRHVQKANF